MNSEEPNSWIFLAAGMSSNSPITFKSILGVADGINHAVPTHKELQNAFKWLLNHKLISKEGKNIESQIKVFLCLKMQGENQT